MRRRGFLALLTPLTTGCLGGVEVSRQGGQSVPADGGENETPTPTTDTATPTPDPVSTPEPDPAADERTASQRLRVAENQLVEAVSAFTGGESLVDVAADDEQFVAREVYVELVRASSAVEEAKARASTGDQSERAQALSGVVAFLSQTTAGQAAMAAGYDALTSVTVALRDGDVARARALVDKLGAHRREVERAASLVQSESADADVEATSAVADDARRRKLAQFDAAVVALDDATRPLRSLIDGVNRLIEARTAVTERNGDEASSTASDAETTLDTVENDLSALVEELPPEAATFINAIERVAVYTGNRSSEAADIRITY